MSYTIPAMLKSLQTHCGKTLFRPEFFTSYRPKNLARGTQEEGPEVTIVKPILHFPGGEVKLGWNVGTRGNGVDEPRWPEDLAVEVVR